MTTLYEPFDGDYIEADYTKLFDDIQTQQCIDIGAWREICASVTREGLIHILCSNDEGDDWAFDYTFQIPNGWNVDVVRDMFTGNVYLKTKDNLKP